jgi:hypothetical protein
MLTVLAIPPLAISKVWLRQFQEIRFLPRKGGEGRLLLPRTRAMMTASTYPAQLRQ